MLPHIAVEGTMVADPELRYSPTGTAVARFRIVANSRKPATNAQGQPVMNAQGQQEWVDDKTLWMSCTAFKQLAENVVESLVKGDRVVVTGKLQTDEWTTEANEKRSTTVLLADNVSKSLLFKAIPIGAGGAERVSSSPAAEDPWATPAPGAQSDEPPF